MRASRLLPAIGACLVALLATSCAPTVNKAATQVTDDPYKNEIAFAGPVVILEQDTSLLGTPIGNGKKCLLRGWKNKSTSALTNQLYMVVTYEGSEWRHYGAATLKGGMPLQFLSIDRHRSNCNHERSWCFYEEDFAVPLSESQLKALAPRGVSVEVQSKAGKDDIFAVTPEYVANYLATIEGMPASE